MVGMSDASEILDRFLASYDGRLGRFERADDSGPEAAYASCPDGDSTSMVRIEVCRDILAEFENRKAFIMSKRKRLGPMGKLEEFPCPCGFDDSYGGILNFKLLGKTGGFFFFAGRKGDVLVFMQVYSTSGGGQIADGDRDGIIRSVYETI